MERLSGPRLAVAVILSAALALPSQVHDELTLSAYWTSSHVQLHAFSQTALGLCAEEKQPPRITGCLALVHQVKNDFWEQTMFKMLDLPAELGNPR
jgi:hypothetical protein